MARKSSEAEELVQSPSLKSLPASLPEVKKDKIEDLLASARSAKKLQEAL
jgi:hypothetical protein